MWIFSLEQNKGDIEWERQTSLHWIKWYIFKRKNYTLGIRFSEELPRAVFSWNDIALAGHTFTQGLEQSAGQFSGSNSVEKALQTPFIHSKQRIYGSSFICTPKLEIKILKSEQSNATWMLQWYLTNTKAHMLWSHW